jgi:hypothetical protein
MDTIDTQDTLLAKEEEIRSLRESQAATALRKGKGFELLVCCTVQEACHQKASVLQSIL